VSGNFLLDTNIVAAILGGDESTRGRFASSGLSFIPSIVLGELVFGAHKSARLTENLARIEGFVRDVPVLACDAATAMRYGALKGRLRAKGRPIPDNDLWIAALALERALTLVTRDDHFSHVEGLALERW
jgi:tRNA(fMet)-specific endonuclease VapC